MRNDDDRDDIVISARNVGKRYLIPQRHDDELENRSSFLDDMKEFFPGLLGVGEDDYFWALRDISFDVRRGEVFGVVGQNGSGKSTLLKILSGITPPTTGRIEVEGRIGSLLEVGTGFHPDHTGRQNIFFNGAILGCSQESIAKKVEDIIAFSGVGRFIDVPVKRYSSGMYVRLAYAVASLLDSDILILDEVLSVGDAKFRSKTKTNIQDASSAGRTVILVSHNPATIIQTCDRVMLLDSGQIVSIGEASATMAEYVSGNYRAKLDGNLSGIGVQRRYGGEGSARHLEPMKMEPTPAVMLEDVPRLVPPGSHVKPTGVIKWLAIYDRQSRPKAEFVTGDHVKFVIGYEGLANPERSYFAILVHNILNDRMTTLHSTHNADFEIRSKDGVVECLVPQLMLGAGLYSIMIDSGEYYNEINTLESQDCISHAGYIHLRDRPDFGGIGVGDQRGCATPSLWTEGDKGSAPAHAERSGKRTLPTSNLPHCMITYPKSGTTWTRFLLGNYFQMLSGYGEPFLFDGSEEETSKLRASGLPLIHVSHGSLTWLTQTARDLTYANAVAPFIHPTPIFMVRFPMDILLSHFMHHHHLKGYQDRKRFDSLRQFIDDPVYGLDKLLHFYNLWSGVVEDDAFLIRYEDLKARPFDVTKRLLDQLNVEFDEEKLERSIEQSSFKNMKKMELSGNVPIYRSSKFPIFATGDLENPNAFHVRSGTAFEYRDHLSSAECRAYEDRILDELSPVFGYQQDFR